jgi:centromeric protein E
MIDLAGSEKASAQESRRKEGAYINKSLLTLGTVISRLTSPGNSHLPPDTNHVPYRDSKITRLLQPSLSGGGYITILATICGGQKYSSETLSTLQFAKRAKNIPAKAVPVEARFSELLAGESELRGIIEGYKAKVDELQKQLADEQTKKGNEQELNELKIQREHLNNRIERLSVLALAAGDARNPIVQQVIPALYSVTNCRPSALWNLSSPPATIIAKS